MVETLKNRISNPLIISAAACALLFYTGTVTVRPQSPMRTVIPPECITAIAGTIDSNPVKSQAGSFYTVQVRLREVSGKCGASSPLKVSGSASGTISVRMEQSAVESLYPGKLYSAHGEKAIIEQGERIRCTGSCIPGTAIFRASQTQYMGRSPGAWGMLLHARALMRLSFKRLMYSWGSAGGLVLSLLAGSREYTTREAGELFRKAGLSHILALSGMHLSFFSAAAGKTGGKLVGKKYAHITQLAGILSFVWFAGLSPSLFRALLCSLFMLLGPRLFVRGTDFLAVLAATFLLHSCIFPGHIQSVAFMLSYGALAGILVISPMLQRPLAFVLPPKTSASVGASLGAVCATAPVGAKFFGVITPVGVVSSVIVSPLISIFLTVSLIAIVLSLAMPFLSPAFGAILNALYRAIIFVTGIFAAVPPITL